VDECDAYFIFLNCGDTRLGETTRLLPVRLNGELRAMLFLARGDALAIDDLPEFFFLIDRGST
jgi:hypothetical protein